MTAMHSSLKTDFDLSKTPPPFILARLHHQCASGRLDIEGSNRGPFVIWWQHGQILAITADHPERRLAQWFVHKNYIPPWEVDLALTQVRENRPIGEVLQQMGLMGTTEFNTLFKEWLFDILHDICPITEGKAVFDPSAEPPKYQAPAIPVVEWLVQIIRDFPDSYPFHQYLPGDRFMVNPYGDEHLVNVRIFKAEKLIFESLIEGRPIQLIARSLQIPESIIERAAYIFLTLNWLKPLDKDQDEEKPSIEQILSATAILTSPSPEQLPDRSTILQMAENLPQKPPLERFDIHEEASLDTVYRAYFKRVRLFNPGNIVARFGNDAELIHAVNRLRSVWRETYEMLNQDYQKAESEKAPPDKKAVVTQPSEDARRAYTAYMEARKFLASGEYENAVKALEKALRFKDDEALYWERLGDARVALKQWKQAEKAYLKAWELQPYNIDIPLSLARLYWQLEKPAMAGRWAREALGIDPTNRQVQTLIRLIDEAQSTKKKQGSLWKRLFGKS